MPALPCDTDWPYVLKYEANWPPASTDLPRGLQEESDERLLELIKSDTGSQSKHAFSALYNRYRMDVWRFIRSRGLDDADSKDVFGEVWAVAVAKLPAFEWRGKPIKSWLLTTASNKLQESYRRAERESCVSLDDEIHTQALHFIKSRLQLDKVLSSENSPSEVRDKADQLLAQAVSNLKSKPRKIIHLIYYKGKNSTEIGQILGMKPGAVRVAHKRALAKIRHYFAADGRMSHG